MKPNFKREIENYSAAATCEFKIGNRQTKSLLEKDIFSSAQ